MFVVYKNNARLSGKLLDLFSLPQIISSELRLKDGSLSVQVIFIRLMWNVGIKIFLLRLLQLLVVQRTKDNTLMSERSGLSCSTKLTSECP